MKILYTITGLGVGGAEKIVTTLADKMVEHGHQVKIVYFYGDALTMPSNTNIEITKLPVTKNPLSILKGILHLRNIINSYKPDIVHSHMFHANIISRLCRLIAPMPKLICSAHSNNEGGMPRMWLYKITDNLADLTTNVSDDATRSYIDKKAAPAHKIRTVLNGIDVSKFQFSMAKRAEIRKNLQFDDDTAFILAVGRFNEAKDYPNLLTAYSKMQSLYDGKNKLVIVGDGSLKAELLKLAENLNINHKIIFLGIRKDVADIMSAADLFVSSSAWEGFGLVIAEAMSCRLLTISTDSGGPREIIGNSEQLVPIRDSDKLAQKMADFLQLDNASREKLIIDGEKRSHSHFSLQEQVKLWLSLYQ